MKRKINIIEMMIYLIFIVSLFAYEIHLHTVYSYIQLLLFAMTLFTFLCCTKIKQYRVEFSKRFKNNMLINLLCLLMIICTLFCCLKFNISFKNILIVVLYIINIFFLFYYIPIYLRTNKEFTSKFTNFVIFTILMISIFGIILYFKNGLFGYYLEGGRSGSIYFDANYFALISTVPMFLIFNKNCNKKIKILVFIISMISILCSGSRGTMLGIGCGIVYFMFIKFPSKNIIKKVFVISLCSILMYSFFIYLSNISFLRLDQGSHGRLEMFSYALELMKQSPFVGFGFDSISSALIDGGFLNTSTHNSLIDFAFRYGYPCLLLYCLFILKIVLITFKDKDNLCLDILLIIFLVNMNTILYSFGGVGIASILLTVYYGVIEYNRRELYE